MNFDEFLKMLSTQVCFDLPTATQICRINPTNLNVQISRWIKAGKLIPLRRGMYAFDTRYRHAEINPAQLANSIYTPSYLSMQWALSFYGLIPEKARTFTSITTRGPKTFTNSFGQFTYRHVKTEAFFGYQSHAMNGAKVLMAVPEKALLDLWHLESGLWDKARMTEMRFQNTEIVDNKLLMNFADRMHSPRLIVAASIWCKLMETERQETVEL